MAKNKKEGANPFDRQLSLLYTCELTIHIKANKNQIAYYFCTPNDDNNGQGCSHHEKWGRVASNQKLKAYWEARRAAERKGVDDDHSGKLVAGGRPEATEIDGKPDPGKPEQYDKPKQPIFAGLSEYIRS